jgi:hypothetical protein
MERKTFASGDACQPLCCSGVPVGVSLPMLTPLGIWGTAAHGTFSSSHPGLLRAHPVKSGRGTRFGLREEEREMGAPRPTEQDLDALETGG